ncbi:hypothetical protein ZIOFF_013440 [Zingiber officinale]|uniref:TRF2/HOY1 PH-like domain-containing protein n=1 Tax=Zingiber officinale TaxID=94328 RepID=A0A8J5HRX1_ZINOF|nr:hypothetical protein ZIOFF_013440 [Zingiber officinale]
MVHRYLSCLKLSNIDPVNNWTVSQNQNHAAILAKREAEKTTGCSGRWYFEEDVINLKRCKAEVSVDAKGVEDINFPNQDGEEVFCTVEKQLILLVHCAGRQCIIGQQWRSVAYQCEYNALLAETTRTAGGRCKGGDDFSGSYMKVESCRCFKDHSLLVWRSFSQCYGEAAELGVLGFLLWISSGGIVWSSDSGKRRADSTQHSAPPPPTMKLEVEEPIDDKRVRLHKRARDASTSLEQDLYAWGNWTIGSLPQEETLDFDSQDTPSPCSIEELASENTSLSCDALFDKEIMDFIPQLFDNDSQSFATSDEQSIISRGNSLYCLLQQNTVGGMVWFSDSGKRRADSTQHLAPPPPAVKLEVEEPLDEKRVRLHKRVRDASTSCEQTLYNKVLGEPGPLGLRPRKSRSIADMIQMMLSQAKAGKTLCFTSSNGSEVGEQSDFSASSSSLSKIKASNFPASLLRIGTWEHVSRYEGDLVAKCYFAKHKLIWEVLEGSLESKIEFHCHINDFIKDDSRTTFSGFYEPGPPCATSSISNKTETRDSFERTLDFDSQDTPSQCSVEELASGNTSLSCDALFDKEITDFIPGNSLCCLLQQNTVGGMVWSSDSSKRRADSTQHSTPPPPAVKLEVEEPLDEKRVRLHKRIRDTSTSCVQALYNNVLGEPGPLGLRPRKSRSLADMSAHGTLDIVLVRPPLFFRATDPQPRKHTPWQATRDFTNGEACIHKRHLLQCPQTLLSKNFAKLIYCDPHLKLLSQQPDIILESSYFNPQYSVLEHQSDSKSHINDTETQDSFERTLDFDSQDTPSPCSVEELASGNTSLSCDALFDKDVTDSIPQFFDNDSQSSAASDEQSIISRGNSLCCLLQQNTVGRMDLLLSLNRCARPIASLAAHNQIAMTCCRLLGRRCARPLASLAARDLCSLWRRATKSQRLATVSLATAATTHEVLSETNAPDEMTNVLADLTGPVEIGESSVPIQQEGFQTENFDDMLEETEKELYPECVNFSALNFLALYNNVLGEPVPFGLRPRKSWSLADMSQMMFSQAKAGNTLCFTSSNGLEVGEQSDFSASSSSLSKIKASNFPSSLLRIGTWEYVSRYEGDLVAKCYFAKHKLIWEVAMGLWILCWQHHLFSSERLILNQGSKHRDKQLEILPMAKHTYTRGIYFNVPSDFIKDDSRTTFSDFYEPGHPCATSSISNKTETRDSFGRTLDFDSQDTPSPCSVEELASGNTSLGNSLCCLLQQKIVRGIVWSSDSGKRRADSTQHSTPPPPAMKLEVEEPLDEKRVRLQKRIRDASTSCEQALYNNVHGEPRPLGLRPRKSRCLADMSQMMLSQSNAGAHETLDIVLARPPLFFRATDPQPRKYTPYLVSNLTETQDSFGRTLDFDSQDTPSPCSVEELASGNKSLSCDALFDKDITDFIPQFFDNDSQSSAASDKKSIISRANSLCCLLQQNIVGRMVWSSNSGKRRADSTQHSAPPPRRCARPIASLAAHDQIATTCCRLLGRRCARPLASLAASDLWSLCRCATKSQRLATASLATAAATHEVLSETNAPDEMTNVLADLTGPVEIGESSEPIQQEGFQTENFDDMLEETEKELYPECVNFSALNFLALYNNVLGEPVPLGLRPRKSWSLADMSQMMFSQAKAGKTLCFTSLKGSEVGEQSDFSASPSSLSKIKASNFPTSLLRIGTRKCVSRYEGDLVAKCYFAKHKLVWEVLEGGLKCKIEFHCSLLQLRKYFLKGQFPLLPTPAKYSGQNGLVFEFRKHRADSTQHSALPPRSTLTIADFFSPVHLARRDKLDNVRQPKDVNIMTQVLGTRSRYVKGLASTNMLFNSTSSATSPASIIDYVVSPILTSQNVVTFSIAYLNASPKIILTFAYEPVATHAGDACLRHKMFCDACLRRKMFCDAFYVHMATLKCVVKSLNSCSGVPSDEKRTLLSKNFEKLIDCDPQLKLLSQQPDIILESPYFNPQYSVLEDQSDSKSHINDFIKDDSRTTFSGFYEPGPPCATSSISNKTETRDSFGRTLDFDSQDTTSPSSVEELVSGNTSLSCDALFDKKITDFIPQFFDNDSQSSAASDEQSIISRGNSLCCLLQQNTVGGMVWSSDSGKRQADST